MATARTQANPCKSMLTHANPSSMRCRLLEALDRAIQTCELTLRMHAATNNRNPLQKLGYTMLMESLLCTSLIRQSKVSHAAWHCCCLAWQSCMIGERSCMRAWQPVSVGRVAIQQYRASYIHFVFSTAHQASGLLLLSFPLHLTLVLLHCFGVWCAAMHTVTVTCACIPAVAEHVAMDALHPPVHQPHMVAKSLTAFCFKACCHNGNKQRIGCVTAQDRAVSMQ